MIPPVLSIEDLTIDLPPWSDRPHAVEDISLKIMANEILCVVGESGSGKSILSKSILQLLPAPHIQVSKGRIFFNHHDLLQKDVDYIQTIRGSQISMIFQEPMTALNPLMSVGQQIDEILKIHTSLSYSMRTKRILELFENVKLPEPKKLLQSYPHELSGGQRQRVMIAMALILKPALIIADEPTTALDVTTQAQILELMKEIQHQNQMSILFITHDFGVVAEIADRIAVMKDGVLIEQGRKTEILRTPREEYTQNLISAVPSLKPRNKYPRQSISKNILEVINIEKTYGGRAGLFSQKGRSVHALADISLEIKKGDSVAIVGESGSGKSTLARCILGLEKPEKGKIIVNGKNISALNRTQLQLYRKTIQMIFQDPFASLNPRQKVGEIISLGPSIQGLSKKKSWDLACGLLETVGLSPDSAHRYPHEFSGGQRQRIGIARALAIKPQLIVADEPVSALDVSVQKQVLELLDDLRQKFSLSILFITHDLRVAAHVCEEIIVMKNGKLIEKGSTTKIFTTPQQPYTKKLLDSIPGKSYLS